MRAQRKRAPVGRPAPPPLKVWQAQTLHATGKHSLRGLAHLLGVAPSTVVAWLRRPKQRKPRGATLP